MNWKRIQVTSETGNALLKVKCATEVRTALERQLSKMSYFFEKGEEAEKLNKGAIKANLGCEGEFAHQVMISVKQEVHCRYKRYQTGIL